MIGQITRFPINTIFTFATSANRGICPQLCGFIHDELSETNANVPVSEHGIRTTLNEIDENIYYDNIGTGYGIWSHTSQPTAFYNSIQANPISHELNKKYSRSFTDGNLDASNKLSISHNLGKVLVGIVIVDNNNNQIIPDEIKFINDSTLEIDFTTLRPLTGTWNIFIFDNFNYNIETVSSSDFTSGIYIFDHNLNNEIVQVVASNTSGEMITLDEINFTNENSCTLNLSSFSPDVSASAEQFNLIAFGRRQATIIHTTNFTSGDVTAGGIFQLSHNLEQTIDSIIIENNHGNVIKPDDIYFVTQNLARIDLSSFTIEGTWKINIYSAENLPDYLGYDSLISWLDNGTVYLSGGAINTTVGVTGNLSGEEVSVQGGLYQYSNTVEISAVPLSGFILANASTDNVIGKIFIKCITPVDQNGALYSIGLTGDNQRYIKYFEAPNTSGILDKDHMDYGIGLSGEYDWLYENKNLMLFRQGNVANYGQLGISIFYDKVIWAPQYGYVLKSNVYRFDMSNMTHTIRLEDETISTANGLNNYNFFIYCFGGQYDSSYVSNIRKLDSKNDTVAVLSLGNLTAGKYRTSVGKSAIKFYIGGGINNANSSVNTIENLTFSNDTANSVSNATFTIEKGSPSCLSTNLYCFWAGGEKWSAGSNVNFANDWSIESLAFTTDTTTNLESAHLSIGRCWTSKVDVSGYGLYVNGTWKPAGAYHVRNVIDKFTFATKSISTLSETLIISTTEMPVNQTNTEAYFIDGYVDLQSSATGYTNLKQVKIVQKIDFATNVTSVINTISVEGNLSISIGTSV